MWLVRRPIVVVLLAGVLVHAGVVGGVYIRTGRIDSHAFDSVDCGEYYRIARNVAYHGVFSQGEEPTLEPDTWRTPGYPLFLAVSMLLLGDSPTILVIVQQLLSILNVLLLYRLASCWMGDRRAMLVAILFLLEPYHLKYSLWLMSTTLFVTTLLLAWHVWSRAIQTRRWGWFALLGGLSGFIVLVRPIGGLIPVALFVGLAVETFRRSRQRSDRPPRRGCRVSLPVFAGICLLVVGSWMLRNAQVAGHFALSDQSGAVLAYFKATEVVLWQEGRSEDRYLETTLDPAKADKPHTVWEAIDTRLRDRSSLLPADQRATLRWRNLAQGNRTTADSFAVSRALGDIGWSYLTASPISTAACCLVRCGSILTFPLNLALRPPAGVEIGRLQSLAVGVVYLALSVAVVVRIVRRRLTVSQVFFPLACSVALLLATTPQLDPRFRVPMIPLLLIVALLPGSATTARVRDDGSLGAGSEGSRSHRTQSCRARSS